MVLGTSPSNNHVLGPSSRYVGEPRACTGKLGCVRLRSPVSQATQVPLPGTSWRSHSRARCQRKGCEGHRTSTVSNMRSSPPVLRAEEDGDLYQKLQTNAYMYKQAWQKGWLCGDAWIDVVVGCRCYGFLDMHRNGGAAALDACASAWFFAMASSLAPPK